MANLTPGGFLSDPHHALPSPTPSSSTHASSPRPARLPRPREKPLKAGSRKEETARRFVDERLLRVSRRYVKKFQDVEEKELDGQTENVSSQPMEAVGYRDFGEIAGDLGEVVEVLWLSGTPSLQIPYFLDIALSISTYLPSFPPSPAPTFTLLNKLDHAFASLLADHDIETGEVLPSFRSGQGGLSRTDMVRCKSLVEATRVQVVEVMSGGARRTDGSVTNGGDDAMETGDETDWETYLEMQERSNWDEDAEEDGIGMEVGRVYERTLVQLGKSLSGVGGYDVGGG